VRFAVAIPQHINDGEFDPAELRRYLARAEELGFHSAWTQEQVLGSIPHLDATNLMTYAAACSDRIRLGCAVYVTPLHVPVHLAKSLSSLDQLSRGRLEIGVGTGGRQRPFAAYGITADRLVNRFTEGIRLMKACWTEPEITFAGEFWTLDGAAMEPKPYQKPHPPLWVGGSHPNAVRRAVRLGTGFFGAGSQTTEQFTGQVRILREAVGDREFGIAKRVYLAVDDDEDRARERMGDALERLYSSPGARNLLPVAVLGSADAVVRGLREVADAGAELILLNPLFDHADQVERLAAEVLPRLS
jgi:alkanesulfonate monooxygenase SsuD/methylene tetrahydromethanopterin reductase-like flavin-dependent oxidoreductase (luciferase family)